MYTSIQVNTKLIPDGARWTDAAKAKVAGFSAGEAYKNGGLICGTGKPKFITIHNTDDLANVHDDGEQYTRATWPNENMGSVRVHFYVDDVAVWQNLRAGTGMFPDDPEGKAEVGWHSGDGTVASGGNMTSIALEVIMGDTAEHDEKAKDNAARLAAWLLWKHGLPIDRLVTHTYWVAKSAGRTNDDVDEQCTTLIAGKKWCPTYIFGSTNHATALKNWKAFKALVYTYIYRGDVFRRLKPDHLLERGRRHSKERYDKKRNAARPPKGTSIEKRPEEVKRRGVFGHWEMDSVMGCKGSKRAMIVLTERKTRNGIILLVEDHTAASVVKDDYVI